ncbi:MAG: bifunctional [glutamine synthetase] adenylyltransferase/[glutamine synthetase]-adenylyl-L-tyrosine phosphorylase [Rhodospirillales bacterium]
MSLVPDPPPSSLPRPYLASDTTLGLQRWEEVLASLDDPHLSRNLQEITAAEGPRRLLAAVFSHSPFLTDCLLKEPALFAALQQEGPDRAMAALLRDLAQPRESEERAALMRRLRQTRRRAALIVALADLAGAWPLQRVTQSLSDLAAGLLNAALAQLLLEAAGRELLVLADPDDPLKACGYVALGMGKLGAGELNFSSDIDLIVLYDPDRLVGTGRLGSAELAQRLTRDLVSVIGERTADGYGFRVDLRLRPDPGATPLAVSLNAALTYYESLGQNWERAAMIKARPVAGDLELGRGFLKEIRPFVWRRSLDFLAIQDIHAIKRQIHATKGGAVVAVEGHNVKLGRGGIREVEFFAQTQQLIWGGRRPALRDNRTKESLEALASEGLVAPNTAKDLYESYSFLRRVEHRLQMVADQQTHSLPRDAEGIERLAAFLGLADGAALRDSLQFHLHRIEDHYARLFEEEEDEKGAEDQVLGSLVFTGDAPGADTVETLQRLGFADPERVFALVRSWHHGRYRATRSTASRERLTLLMPRLLAAFGGSADPDGALTGFDAFLAGLPAGIQLFALLRANPQLLGLLASVMGSAPALAQQLARRPALIDSLLSPDFYGAIPKRQDLRAEMTELLDTARSYEEQLDLLRRSSHDRRFQAGVQLLLGLSHEEPLARRLSDIADAALGCLLDRVQEEFAQRHGRIAGADFAILALGKLGSRELTFTSDLDLVFLYDVAEAAEASDGERPLDPTTYFQRFSQRLINAITAPTAEGRLYNIDMRLRPAGDAGPLASRLAGFLRYQKDEAWTWEHMALTRGRLLSNSESFRQRAGAAIQSVLRAHRDPDRLLLDVAAMRARLEREKPAKGPWDLKQRHGGLLDVEFLAQYWQLLHAQTEPEVLRGDTAAAIRALGEAGLIEEDLAKGLGASVHFLRRLQGYLRLTLGEGAATLDLADAPEAIRAGTTKACGALDFARLEDTLEEVAQFVGECFREQIADPAKALDAQTDSIAQSEERQG